MREAFGSPSGHLANELLSYLMHHPEAQGTVESIVEWWLLEQRIRRAAEEVRSVLSELVAKGFVIECARADGRICYQLNSSKETEIRAWMATVVPTAGRSKPGS